MKFHLKKRITVNGAYTQEHTQKQDRATSQHTPVLVHTKAGLRGTHPISNAQRSPVKIYQLGALRFSQSFRAYLISLSKAPPPYGPPNAALTCDS